MDADYDFLMVLRRQLVGLGFTETRSVSLVREEAGAGGVALKIRWARKARACAGTLLPGLLVSAGRNVRQGSADLRLFEIGRVFTLELKLGQPEPVSVSVLMTGAAAQTSWRHGSDGRTLICTICAAFSNI